MDSRVAWITGSGRGLGAAIARRLAADGLTVCLSDLDLAAAQEVAAEIESAGGAALAMYGDVTDQESTDSNIGQILDSYGRIDVLVANAGIIIAGPPEELDIEKFQKILDVNTLGVWRCNRAVVPTMKRQRSGKIINCASIAGHRGSKDNAIYCASKFAVVGLTQALAHDMAEFGVTVNAYCPGIVDTDMWVYMDKVRSDLMGRELGAGLQAAIDQIPLGRVEQPEDVANFVSFLASPDSDYMTGQSVNICGGLHML
ncbi:MAG: glucose 1-dehydrogenase [Chloroflexi bacterium]|nr:glucose 1-dehydrogenase [Chloroflexota bacterium]